MSEPRFTEDELRALVGWFYVCSPAPARDDLLLAKIRRLLLDEFGVEDDTDE